MGVPFHTPGPAGLLYTGSLLGYGLDGVEIELVPHHRAVKYDVFGGTEGPPADFQMMLEEAFISCTLEAFDWSILRQAIQNSRAGANPGIMPPAGTLLGANGFLKPLVVQSPTDDKPFMFPSVILITPTRIHKGTIVTEVPCLFHAIPFLLNADSSAGAVLYT